MIIKRTVAKDTFYSEILKMLSSINPLSKLRPKELDLLAELMRQNDANRDLDKLKRRIYIFSTENRKNIKEILNCSADALNNNMSILRKHKLLNSNNELLPILDVDSTKGFEFNLKISVND